jgi:hypothetical protein
MPTLAETLRGYQPPTTSALADPIKEHFRTLPQQIETNQRAMDKTMGGMYQTDPLGKPNPNYYPEAMGEFTQMMPNMMGAISKVLPRKEIIAKELEKVLTPTEYRGSHTAPNAKEYGGTLDALHQIMPADVYTQQGKRLYGINDPTIDHEWYMAALKSKGKPENIVEVHRAVPKGVADINNGDWVTTSKKYATMHGDSALNGEYDLLSKKVKANTLSSEGYPYEFGYHE